MRLLDLVIDMETCGTTPNAAVMQVACLPFNRDAKKADDVFPDYAPFEAKVDLRSCVMDGYDFDRSTIKWWTDKPQRLKQEVSTGTCYPIKEVFQQLFAYVTDVKAYFKAEVVTMWAQGSDFDLAIMRNVCAKSGLVLPVSFHNFRDARTFIIEVGSYGLLPDYFEGIKEQNRVYNHIADMPGDTQDTHNAMYDCRRTAWNVYVCMGILSQIQEYSIQK